MNGQRGDKQSSGFTLIELITAIGVIGILAGLTLGTVKFAGQKSDRIKAVGDLKTIEKGIVKYKNYYGNYPPLPSQRMAQELCLCAMLWYLPRGTNTEAYPIFLEMPGWRGSDNTDQARIVKSWDLDVYGLYDPWGDPYIYEPIMADGRVVTKPEPKNDNPPVAYRLYSYGGDKENEQQWIYSGKVN